MQQPSVVETRANIAFFIQGYSKTVHLLPSLLDVVWHPANIYAVHVDAEVPDTDLLALNAMLRNPKFKNVLLMPRQHVTYLGITTLLGTIDAMAFLLNHSRSWHYFINLSGADYPLLKPDRIRELLAAPEILSHRLNFVQSHNDPRVVRPQVYESRFNAMWVDTALWLDLADKPSPASRRTKPGTDTATATDTDTDTDTDTEAGDERCKHGCLWKSNASAHPLLLKKRTHGTLPIVKTEAWVILHRSFVEHVVESSMSRRLQAILTNMVCPEEFFFGTLLRLSTSFRDTTVFDAFRCVLWTHKRYNGSRPPELDSERVENVTAILRDSGAMFARKMMKRASPVKAFVDAELMGLLDDGGRVRGGMGINGTSEPASSERYRATVERRVRCMVQLRWRWRSNYARYTACLRQR